MKQKTGKNKKKRKGTIVIWIILIIVLIVGISIYNKSVDRREASKVYVTVQTVEKNDIQETITGNGTVGGGDTVIINAPADGIVKEVFVKQGQEVEAGSVIFQYDLESLEKERYKALLLEEKTRLSYDSTLDGQKKAGEKVNEAEHNLEVLDTQIKDYTNYLENLEKSLNKYKTDNANADTLKAHNLQKSQAQLTAKLAETTDEQEYENISKELAAISEELDAMNLQKLLISKSEYVEELEKKISDTEKSLAECKAYKAEMETQKNAGESAKMDKYASRQFEIERELAEIKSKEDAEKFEKAKEEVKSPFRGIISGCELKDGASVMTSERTDIMKVKATASDYAILRLQSGQKVEVEINNNRYEGIVGQIERLARMTEQKTMMVNYEVELVNPDEHIYLGETAKLTILTQNKEQVLSVPTEAICSDMDGEFVYTVNGQTIEIKRVTCGISADGIMEITSGLNEGDQVVTDYSGILEEGMQVIVQLAH